MVNVIYSINILRISRGYYEKSLYKKQVLDVQSPDSIKSAKR